MNNTLYGHRGMQFFFRAGLNCLAHTMTSRTKYYNKYHHYKFNLINKLLRKRNLKVRILTLLKHFEIK